MKSSTIRKIACALALANLISVTAVTGCNNKDAIDPSGVLPYTLFQLGKIRIRPRVTTSIKRALKTFTITR